MDQQLIQIGWREWLSLPDLGLPRIKAKIDTGARTSALHACFIEEFSRDPGLWVRFGVHPLQKRDEPLCVCEAPVKEVRRVSDSGGHQEDRYVIETTLQVAGRCRLIELTLTNRESMLFRMLLGRTAMHHLFTVNPSVSYQLGRPKKGELAASYPGRAS